MTKKELKAQKIRLGKVFGCPKCKKDKLCTAFYDWTRAGNQICKSCARKRKKEGYKRKKGVPWYLNLTPEQRRRYAKKRYLQLKKATPVWADKLKMKEMYARAKKLGFHVDHIVPIQGELVCGLHVEQNLQFLSPKANRKKSNKF